MGSWMFVVEEKQGLVDGVIHTNRPCGLPDSTDDVGGICPIQSDADLLVCQPTGHRPTSGSGMCG